MSSFFRFFSGTSPTNVHPHGFKTLSPAQRLSTFKLTWLTVQRSSALTDKKKRQVTLLPLIETLSELLHDEVTRQTRIDSRSERMTSSYGKSCLEYALQRDVFGWLVELAISQKLGEEGELELAIVVVRFLVRLVETQDDDFLTHEVVCKAHLRILRFLGHMRIQNDRDAAREPIMELLFAVCQKIRHFPALLAMFFDADAWRIRLDHTKSSDIVREEDEFMIFYLLMDNMHAEGQSGDFSRAALLMLLEGTKESEEVQRWIAESEFPIFQTVALGASYSQLGFRLNVQVSAEKSLLLASSVNIAEGSYPSDANAPKVSSDPDQLAALDTFLAYLRYWQEILYVCTGHELKQALLDSFQILFLQGILYPSLLGAEANEAAFFTYLAYMMQILQHPELVSSTINYLFGLHEIKQTSKAGQRATIITRQQESYEPSLLSLKDMITANISSTSTTTRIATIKLLEALIAHHWQYCFKVLFRTVLSPEEHPSIGHHCQEMHILATLTSSTSAELDSDQEFQCHLADNVVLLEAQNQSIVQLFSMLNMGNQLTTQAEAVPFFHTIAPNDPLLHTIISLFANWFANDIVLNLSLTGVLRAMVSCRHRSLASWLLFAPKDAWLGPPGTIAPDYSLQASVELDDEALFSQLEETLGQENVQIELDESDDTSDCDVSEEGRKLAAEQAQMMPSWTRFPPFLTMLKTLSAQVRHYKSENETLEEEIAERRRAFKSAEGGDENMQALLIAEALMRPAGTALPGQESASRSSSKLSPKTMKKSTTPSFLRRMTSMTTLASGSPEDRSSRGRNGIDASPGSPFAKHFNSTRRQVNALHSLYYIALAGGGALDDSDIGPGHGGRPSTNGKAQLNPGQLSASSLINNIILFEETIKELMSIVEGRRMLFERDACLYV